jgi:hypothetical protein
MPELRVIDPKEVSVALNAFGKGLIGLLVGLAGLMQIDAVKNFVTPILAMHPKISSIVMALCGIGLLLQNPYVRKILHIDTVTQQTTTTISTSAGGAK